MLSRLGAPNTALCFAGGNAGDECFDWLHNSGRPFYRFATTTPTRTGTVVRAPGQPETTFLGADAPPDARALRACADFLDAQPADQVLAICGSLPWLGFVRLPSAPRRAEPLVGPRPARR